MKHVDTRVFSIIVKVWVEDSDQPTWHGQITHIPSGEQCYVSRVEDIAMIVSRYLATFGFKPDMCVRVWPWVRRLVS